MDCVHPARLSSFPNRRLEAAALVFFVALNTVVATGRGWAVLFALEIAVNPIAGDGDPAPVTEHLNVRVDGVASQFRRTAVGDDLDRTGHSRVFNSETTTLFDLDRTTNPRRTIDRDRFVSFGLDVSDHVDRGRFQCRPSFNLDRPFDLCAIERTGRTARHLDVVEGNAPEGPSAGCLLRSNRRRRGQRPGEHQRCDDHANHPFDQHDGSLLIVHPDATVRVARRLQRPDRSP